MKFIVIFIIVSCFFQSCKEVRDSGNSLNHWAETESIYRDTIPCILQNSSDILFLNLGRIDYPTKQGVFIPNEDKIILNDGTIISNYYRDSLGIDFYKPLHAEKWGHAPTGWCSWYFYFKNITAVEVKKNVDWLAAYLKDYGVDYVQIDDGWMHEIGEGVVYKPNDWSRSNEKFPDGMKDLADYIKSQGFIPGLWLSPQGQSDSSLLSKWPETFLKNDSLGYDISGFWGRYLLDPSSPEAHAYLSDLFKKMDEWGYEYYKIDGQPSILNEYIKQQKWMRHAGDPVDLYQSTIKTIKETIGENRYLLGSWGTPEEGISVFDGSRTGGDIGFNGNWYEVALRATMRYLFLNNIVWHSDPDVVMVRDPIPVSQARLWATFIGISGQVYLLSDRLYDLSDERIEILKKTLPATPIQPVELYAQEKIKNIWDLKISHLNQDYDVVGVFNFVNSDDYSHMLSWESLGNESESLYHVFNFWEGTYLGAWKGGYYVKVQPESTQVLGITKVRNGPQLISTSRHITQGWIDLKSLEYDENTISGISEIINNDPYTLYFAFPPGEEYSLVKVECHHKYEIRNHGTWSELTLFPEKTGEAAWKGEFEQNQASSFLISAQEGIPKGMAINTNQILFGWYQSPPVAGHLIYLDDKLIGFSPLSEVVLDFNDFETHRLDVSTIGWNGVPDPLRLGLSFTLKDLIPDRISLADMQTDKAYLEGPGETDRRFFLYRKNHRLEYGNPSCYLMIKGKRYVSGIATHSNSDFIYSLKSYFSEFTADIGVDQSSNQGSVIFKILCDGAEVYNSGIMTEKSSPKMVKINVKQIDKLRLIVLDAGDGIDGDLANWADPYLWR